MLQNTGVMALLGAMLQLVGIRSLGEHNYRGGHGMGSEAKVLCRLFPSS